MADTDAGPRGQRVWLWIISGLAVIGGLAVLAILSRAILSSMARKPAPQTAATEVPPTVAKLPDLAPDEVAHRAIASVMLLPTWEKISVYGATAQSYIIHLDYKMATPPPTRDVVERDTTTIVRAVAETARAAGYPKGFNVMVSAAMPGYWLGYMLYSHDEPQGLLDFTGVQIPLPPTVAPDDVARRAIASVTRLPAWEDIIVHDAFAKGFTIDLRYKVATPPPTRDVVERDTTTIGYAVAKTAREAGYQPKDFFIMVNAAMLAMDATGKVSGLYLGSTTGNCNVAQDSFTFDFSGVQVPVSLPSPAAAARP